MSSAPKILIVSPSGEAPTAAAERAAEMWSAAGFEAVAAGGLVERLRQAGQCEIAGLFVDLGGATADSQIAAVLHGSGLLETLPEGMALLDRDLKLLWMNPQLRQWMVPDGSPGASPSQAERPSPSRTFYEALGSPEILGPDYCPFHTALVSRHSATTTLRSESGRYFQVIAAPIYESPGGEAAALLALVREITDEVLQQQKLNAIHRAGVALADISPDELVGMSVHERIELLKSNIIQYTKDVLNFDTIEIRLLDHSTGRLEPLLAVGMDEAAKTRELFAKPQDNGVTGFVAATGKSYLCEDITNDPLYLPGAPGARSSLTVPLILHSKVIGTFNVESPEPGAFTEHDLQFLEIFSRDIALASNTLELLVAEKMTTASESVERIHREVAIPVDEILNDAASLLEGYIGHDSGVPERLRHVLQNARDIKQLIQKVGEQITPQVAHPPVPPRPQRPKLRARRVLVADADEEVRRAAHDVLDRYGCIVETAHDGREALIMARASEYDAVLADIRLPDMTGYECFCRMNEVLGAPVILMTGYGYDPSHSIVNARKEGLKTVLYKPFRVDQLLEAVESAVDESAGRARVPQAVGPAEGSSQ